MNLFAPLRFRFEEPNDARVYGDGWYVYDEAKIARLPARELAKLELEIGLPLVEVITSFRRDTVMSRLAAAWLAIRLVDPKLAGKFDDFTPLILLVVWHLVPADEAPKEAMQAPLDPADSTTSSSTPPVG